MKSAIETYFEDIANDGTHEEFDFGNDGYVDMVIVVELSSEDRALWPEDFDTNDVYASVAWDNQGFVSVGSLTQDEYLALVADYADFCRHNGIN